MSHCRLIYQSTVSDKFLPNTEIKSLVERSSANNRALGITGLLLLSGDHFLQVLEGPADAVNALFARIMADPRHRDIRLLTFEPTSEIYFDDWNMYLVDLFDLPKAPRDYFVRKYRSRDGAVLIPERLHEVYALLLDARAVCVNRPWDAEIAPLP